MTGNPHPRVLPMVSIVAVLGALAVLVAVFVQRQRQQVLSDEILPPGEPGDGARMELLPDLDRSLVVVPDRPHNPGELRPGALDRVTRRREFTISTNSRGLRGPEVQIPAPGYRVLCVGDSVTLGWGVAYEESWPARLAASKELETVIAAVPGALPEVMLPWIRRESAGLDADLVLFTWAPLFEGEPLDALVADLETTAEEIAPIPLGWVLPPTSTFDLHGHRVARHLFPRLQGRVPGIPVLDLAAAFRQQTPSKGVIGQMRDDGQLMLRLPDLAVVARGVPASGGGPLADEITAAFEAEPTLREPLFFDQGHPDAGGLQLMAEVIGVWIREQGWLSTEGGPPSSTPDHDP